MTSLVFTNGTHHHLFLFWCWQGERFLYCIQHCIQPCLLFIASVLTFIAGRTAATEGAAICSIVFERSFSTCKHNFAALQKLCANACLLQLWLPLARASSTPQLYPNSLLSLLRFWPKLCFDFFFFWKSVQLCGEVRLPWMWMVALPQPLCLPPLQVLPPPMGSSNTASCHWDQVSGAQSPPASTPIHVSSAFSLPRQCFLILLKSLSHPYSRSVDFSAPFLCLSVNEKHVGSRTELHSSTWSTAVGCRGCPTPN